MKEHINRWLVTQEPLLSTGSPPVSDRAANLALRDAVRVLETTLSDSDWTQALRISLAGYLEELLSQWQECLLLRRDIQIGVAQGVMPSHYTQGHCCK